MSLKIIILAAGKGTRMKSEIPKVLHEVAGSPMLGRVITACRGAGASRIVGVVSGEVERLSGALGKADDLHWALQEEQLGTGHATLCAKEALQAKGSDKVLIINGDMPRLRAETLKAFIEAWEASKAPAALLSTEVPDPSGYGRILRSAEGKFTGVVEDRDADQSQRKIAEINVGIYGATTGLLYGALDRAGNDNDQGEYYLPDAFKILLADGVEVEAIPMDPPAEFEGVNTRIQLAEASAYVYGRKAAEVMLSGVTLVDPTSVYIEDSVVIGQDTILEPGVLLKGSTKIEEGCRVGAYSVLTDSELAAGVEVKSHCVLEKAKVGKKATVGPFARLREGTDLGEKSKVGNFVETKKAKLGEGAKASHLSYLGDCEIGGGSNIGAGTITCNYDGFAKHFTDIGEDVFVGSNSTLVAPVALGKGSFVAAGSTVTRSSKPDDLVLGRARQTIKAGYAERLRSRMNSKNSDSSESEK